MILDVIDPISKICKTLINGSSFRFFKHADFQKMIFLSIILFKNELRPRPPPHFKTSGASGGDHFGTSGRPWRTMGTARWTRGGPEQYFYLFLKTIMGPYFEIFLSTEAWNSDLCSGVFPSHFFIDVWSEISTFGAPNSKFSHRVYCKKINFAQALFFIIAGYRFVVVFWKPWKMFLVFAALETRLNIDG